MLHNSMSYPRHPSGWGPLESVTLLWNIDRGGLTGWDKETSPSPPARRFSLQTRRHRRPIKGEIDLTHIRLASNRVASPTAGYGECTSIYAGHHNSMACNIGSQARAGSWSAAEDRALKAFIHINSASRATDWTAAATFVTTRSAKQCRERWVNYLDPHLSHDNLDPEIVWNTVLRTGRRWVKAKEQLTFACWQGDEFVTRYPSENAIKNCYYAEHKRRHNARLRRERSGKAFQPSTTASRKAGRPDDPMSLSFVLQP